MHKNPTVYMNFPQTDLKSVINFQVNKRLIKVNAPGSLVFNQHEGRLACESYKAICLSKAASTQCTSHHRRLNIIRRVKSI